MKLRPADKTICIFLSLLLCESNTAASISSSDQTSNIRLVATPEEIHQGFTSHLTLTCSFTDHPSANFSSVMSIILSKASIQDSASLTEIAAVSHPNKVTVKNSLGANVTGQLETSSIHSYLTFDWSYPTNDVQGSYKCDVYGMDDVGHPRSESAVVEIGERSIDLEAVLQKIKEMDLSLNGKIDALISQNNKAWAATFMTSATFQGHKYFLSRPAVWDVTVSESVCEAYDGGYLVEVNDQSEYDFVVDLLNNNTVQYWTAIGVNDLEMEGVWTFLHSRLLATYLNWSPNEPSNGARGYEGEDCVFLTYDSTIRQMHDGVCQDDRIYNFLCEIE